MKRFFTSLALNVAIFIAVRYLSLLSAFLLGMGASDHYKYESYIYMPGTVIQIGGLLYLFFRSYAKGYRRFELIVVVVVVVFLSIAGFIKLIPYSLIPY